MKENAIDEVDRSIIQVLQKNGRLSNKHLAERVGLSAAPCWQRLRRLEQDGFIKGYSAEIDLEKLGFNEVVLLEVQLERHDRESVRAFGDAVARIPEVLEVYLTSGGFDYFIKVAVKGTKDYEAFLQDKLYHVSGIRHSRSVFTLRCLKQNNSVQI